MKQIAIGTSGLNTSGIGWRTLARIRPANHAAAARFAATSLYAAALLLAGDAALAAQERETHTAGTSTCVQATPESGCRPGSQVVFPFSHSTVSVLRSV